MKTLSLREDILSCSPRGFSRALSHAETFQEPMELSSGLANADILLAEDGCSPQRDRSGAVIIVRHPDYVSPGTFAKIGGRLKKAGTRSALHGQRWNNPATAAKAHKHNPSVYQNLPSVKEREAALHEVMENRQRKAIKALCKRYKIKRPRTRAPEPSGWLPPPPPDAAQIDRFKATRKPGETYTHWLKRTA